VHLEVFSDSTDAYDRGKKFEHYRHIATLRESLLVSQKEPRLEPFIRQADSRWLLNEAAGLEATPEVPSLHIILSLAEVFAHLNFGPTPIRGAISALHPPR
jgi:Uma2 family endonuclease